MPRKLLQNTAVLILAILSLAGCSTYPDSAELKPLEFTYIRIGQDQYSTGGLNPTYEGSIAFPSCLYNPNDHDLMAEDGYEIFQVLGPPTSGSRLVASWTSGQTDFRSHLTAIPVGMIHNVLLNETIEGNSTDYTIHFWHQILNPEPMHRVDRWFNMTFTPYGPSDTTYSEGEPC